MREVASINQAFSVGLNDIQRLGRLVPSVTDTTSVGSQFGRRLKDYREILGYSFVLLNPRNRLVTNTVRNVSFGFAVANFIWVLAGRKDVESISFYNSKGRAFSSDGKYYESAFGDRIFGTHNQWEKAKARIIADRHSRRAYLPMYFPQDLIASPLDLSCATGIQFLIREDRLDLVLLMRSQSVAMVFPYDIFLFSLLHEYFSLELDVSLGKLHYFAASFHYYQEEEEAIVGILKQSEDAGDGLMPEMDKLDATGLSKVVNGEAEIRQCIIKKGEFPVHILEGLTTYWRSMLITLWKKGCMENDYASSALALDDRNIFRNRTI